MTFDEVRDLADLVGPYRELRAAYPAVAARTIVEYLKRGEGEPFEVFTCPGHEWVYTGSAYGGDDESYHGEGRVYCSHCGADGDA